MSKTVGSLLARLFSACIFILALLPVSGMLVSTPQLYL